MDKKGAGLTGGAGHVLGCLDVEARGLGGVGLGTVHVGPGGQVKNGPGLQVLHRRRDAHSVGDVKFLDVRQAQGVGCGSGARQIRTEGVPQEAPRPGHENGIMLYRQKRLLFHVDRWPLRR